MENSRQNRPTQDQRSTKLQSSRQTEKNRQTEQNEALRGSLPILAMLAAADAFEARQLSATNVRELAGAIGNQAMLAALGKVSDDAVQVRAAAAILAAPIPEFVSDMLENEVAPAEAFAPAGVPNFAELSTDAVSVTQAAQMAIGLTE